LIALRDYQQKLIDDIYEAWGRYRSVLAVLSTGGGKTVIFSSITHGHAGASCITVHRKEIVAQISLSLAKMGVKHRIIAPSDVVARIRRRHLKVLKKSFVDQQAQCGVASVQTLISNSSKRNMELQRWLKQVTLSVYDEGHHYVRQGIWAQAVELFPGAKLLFVTATPERADGKGLGSHETGSGFCEIMVEGPQTEWLIANGFLCKFKYFCPDSDLDLEGLAIGKNGDINSKALRARVVDSSLVGDCVAHYQRFAPGERAIGFATDVASAEDMAAAFRAAGYRSKSLHGGTDPGERDAVLQEFEGGELDVLWNVDLFDEGFDVPMASCAILGRPTMSLAKFLQMCGRVLRTAEGKEWAYIIDPVRNQERHLTPNVPRVWTLDDREKRGGAAADTGAQKICNFCTQPFEAYHRECPYCGCTPEITERDAPEKVDGDLFELDVNAMAALFKRQAEADCSDMDFERNLISKNVPGIGHARLVKRHQRDVYRRQVLREFVGWWVGMQPKDRDLSEVHRRFYHRFGVDIGNAFTLPATETDSLIEKISERFTSDIAV
jgi:superfamily II DNA or RNA helicase